jgi:hypothetical protein
MQFAVHTSKDIFTCMSVTVDGLWVDEPIYCILWYSAWSRFTLHYYTNTHTSVHSHVFTCRCSIAVSNSGRCLSSRFANCPRPQLQQLCTNWLLSHSPTNSNNWTHSSLTVLLMTSRHESHRKHHSFVAFYGSLFNCLFISCIFKSSCRVWFETYHGAPDINRSVLDWSILVEERRLENLARRPSWWSVISRRTIDEWYPTQASKL